MKGVKNIPFSVSEKLKNKARQDKRPFNELLQYFAMERFLYRLSKSKHADFFILKGALMLQVWNSSQWRPTMDIDMLANTSNSESNLAAIIRNIIETPIEENDGICFYSDTITTKMIKEDADYHGVRILFQASLDTAKIHIQIDVGFDDIVYPGKELRDFPVQLNFSQPRLNVYSKESVIAEKFEAMVKLGNLNSRMKDFYDIWLLANHFQFEVDDLAEAIRLTFNHRKTSLPTIIVAFSDSFVLLKQIQWKAFKNKTGQKDLPESFGDIVQKIKEFLEPIVLKLIEKQIL